MRPRASASACATSVPPHASDAIIDDIDHTGNVASVRTRYLFEALNYTDYLTLLKIDAGWKIACKAFHHD